MANLCICLLLPLLSLFHLISLGFPITINHPSSRKRVSGRPCSRNWAPDSHPSAVSPKPCSKITAERGGFGGSNRRVLKPRPRKARRVRSMAKFAGFEGLFLS